MSLINMNDWHKLDFSTPIRESAFVNNEFLIRGIAISETTTHNNHKYIAEELEKAAPGLIGRPLLVDHDNRVESIKGRVTMANFDTINKNVPFEAKVMDKNIQEMIKDGRLSSVSIGAFAEDLTKEDDGSIVARGLKIVELSLVAVPADENANFALAMSKCYDLKESMQLKTNESIKHGVSENISNIDERRVNEMTEKEESKVDEKYESALSENKKLLDKLSALEASNKSLQEDKRKSLLESYKKICQEKKVIAKDLTNATEETVRFLIEQISEIEVKSEKEFKAQLPEAFPEEMKGLVESREAGIDSGRAFWIMPDWNAWKANHSAYTRGRV